MEFSAADDKWWIRGGIGALLARAKGSHADVSLRPHERSGILAAAVVAEAAMYEADIRRATSDIEEGKESTATREFDCNPKVARLLVSCRNHQVPWAELTKPRPPKHDGLARMTDVQWLSGVFALRNLLVHADEPNNHDQKHLRRLKDAGLSHDMDSLDEDFVEEAAFRWATIGPVFLRLAQARHKSQAASVDLSGSQSEEK